MNRYFERFRTRNVIDQTHIYYKINRYHTGQRLYNEAKSMSSLERIQCMNPSESLHPLGKRPTCSSQSAINEKVQTLHRSLFACVFMWANILGEGSQPIRLKIVGQELLRSLHDQLWQVDRDHQIRI